MNLKDYTTEELKAELKRASEFTCFEHFERRRGLIMISFNQPCNQQCKDCKVYNICSIRHIVPINQELII